jgi:hypothetical protein
MTMTKRQKQIERALTRATDCVEEVLLSSLEDLKDLHNTLFSAEAIEKLPVSTVKLNIIMAHLGTILNEEIK